jgi:tripartite-type tricarboxylate transporter receptor subunit TctC
MPRFTSIARHALMSAISAVVAASAVQAQTAPAGWPSKPIRILVAFPPGGLTDAYARMFAEQLGAKVNQPVVVENKPGAGAVIALDAAAKSPPDGHTLVMTTSGTVWQNRILYTKLPYNLDKDLVPVTLFPSGPLVLAVPEKLGVNNIKEFNVWLKANPNGNMGTYAPGSYPHMVADQLNRQHGSKIVSVHYKGESPMWVDMAGGQLQMAIGSYQAFNTVATRGVKPIGVTGIYRSPKLPNVPTLAEQGMEDALVKLEGGLPLMAPAGTPEAVLKFLADVAVAGAETPAAAALRTNFGIPNKPQNLEGTRVQFAREMPVWVKLAQELGIKLD